MLHTPSREKYRGAQHSPQSHSLKRTNVEANQALPVASPSYSPALSRDLIVNQLEVSHSLVYKPRCRELQGRLTFNHPRSATQKLEVTAQYTQQQDISTMPYLIWVPHDPRPYTTNDPRIFMDAKSWSWEAESRPYTDAFCTALKRQEDAKFEGERRAARLEGYWNIELERRKEPAEETPVITVEMRTKHTKNDSVHT